MNAGYSSIYDQNVMGIGFNRESVETAYFASIAEADPEVAFPDCPKCGGQADGYGYCFPCNERTVWL